MTYILARLLLNTPNMGCLNFLGIPVLTPLSTYLLEDIPVLPAKSDYENLPLLTQLLYGLAIAICLVLGVIGVILPIIPGIPFLFIAVMFAAKLSPRVELFLHTDPRVSRLKTRLGRFWRSSSALHPLQQLKLIALLGLRSLFDGVRAVFSLLPMPRAAKRSKHH